MLLVPQGSGFLIEKGKFLATWNIFTIDGKTIKSSRLIIKKSGSFTS
jgi:hypothetical protein